MPSIPLDEFQALVTNFAREVKAELTSAEAKAELALWVSDVAALEARIHAAPDPTLKEHYAESLDRLVAHAAVMLLSRLNVKQAEASEIAQRILVASLRTLAKAFLGPLGALV
jgi:hypothetical protein